MLRLLLFAFLFPVAVLLCGKKKIKSIDQIQLQPTAASATPISGGQRPPMPQREADDMETVDGCKSNWGKVQDAPKVSQAKNLALSLERDLDNVIVTYAMRYGLPSIEKAVNELTDSGCDRLLCFALYPQYSATTIGSVNDKFFEALMKKRHVPTVRTVPSYPSDPVYIEALAESIEDHLETLTFRPDVILASYHSIPQKYSDHGDPYQKECLLTTALLRRRLSLGESQLLSSFQSRVGPSEWLRPYTDHTVVNLAKRGVQSVVVLTPGFVADCLETLDEMAIEAAELFYENGGKNFSLVPCLNDSERGIKVLESVVRRELSGWI